MANKPTDIAAQRDKLADELQDLYEDLEDAKQKIRDKPSGDRRALEELKRKYAEKSDEFAELARATALHAGVKNYQPPRGSRGQ